MIIKIEKPPQLVWDGVHQHFDIEDDQTIYTYGKTLYNPANIEIDTMLFNHEMVHMGQQQHYEGGPDAWWERYFIDPEFRQGQEIEAYHIQYVTYCKQNRDRNAQARYLDRLAVNLASPTYKLWIGRIEATMKIKYNTK